MNSTDKKHIQDSFDWIHKLAGEWTRDYRSLAINSNVVCKALHQLFTYDETTHEVKMTAREQSNIVSCLRTVSWAASHATTDSRVLATYSMTVLDALNELFKKEGLEPIKELYPKDK